MDVQVFLPGCKTQLLLWNRRYNPDWTCCLSRARPGRPPARDSTEARAEERVPAAVTLPCPAETVTDSVTIGYVSSAAARPFSSC